MRAIVFILTPTIILLICCAVTGAPWYYYVIMWFTGNVIGALALLTIMLIKNTEEDGRTKETGTDTTEINSSRGKHQAKNKRIKRIKEKV